jgi:hypothetical protein
MRPDFWGVFHDGTITNAEGAVPGDVRLFIEIPYLRKMFPGEGEGFFVHLKGCSSIAFRPYDRPSVETLDGIVKAEPEILDVESTAPVILGCTDGTLSMSYQSASVSLNTGEDVGYPQLLKACEDYWNAWEETHKSQS